MKFSTCASRLNAPVACAIAACLLSACASITTLNNGTSSIMPTAQDSLRNSLIIDVPAHPITLVYKPIRKCTYKEENTPDNTAPSKNTLDISITKQRDKYFVSLYRNDAVFVTGLIGPTGKLFNYTNRVDDLGVVNPTNVDQANRVLIDRHRQTMNPLTQTNAKSLNLFSLLLPEWARPFRVPGEAVGHVLDEERSVWGTYIFRGITNYNGAESAVVDLQRTVPSLGNETVTVGFSIIDVKTALPLLQTISSGNGSIRQQISCL